MPEEVASTADDRSVECAEWEMRVILERVDGIRVQSFAGSECAGSLPPVAEFYCRVQVAQHGALFYNDAGGAPALAVLGMDSGGSGCSFRICFGCEVCCSVRVCVLGTLSAYSHAEFALCCVCVCVWTGEWGEIYREYVRDRCM
jgi:hypothetical protein